MDKQFSICYWSWVTCTLNKLCEDIVSKCEIWISMYACGATRKGWLLNKTQFMCQMGWEREHTFDVVHLFESSLTLDVPAFWDGLFDTDCDSKAALARSLSFASREANSSSNSPGCIASRVADELTLKMDSRQSLATSRASASTPGANSTAF